MVSFWTVYISSSHCLLFYSSIVRGFMSYFVYYAFVYQFLNEFVHNVLMMLPCKQGKIFYAKCDETCTVM